MGPLTSSPRILVAPPTRLSYTIPGEPVPTQPAAIINGYVAKRGQANQRAYRDHVALHTMLAVNRTRWHSSEWDRAYHVTLRAYLERIHDKDGRFRKFDVDNIAKGVLDGIKSRALPDDSQIVRLVVEKHLDAGKPRLEVEIERIGG